MRRIHLDPKPPPAAGAAAVTDVLAVPAGRLHRQSPSSSWRKPVITRYAAMSYGWPLIDGTGLELAAP